MDRRVLVPAMVVLVLTLGCTTAGVAQQTAITPPPCPGDVPDCDLKKATDKTGHKVLGISIARDGTVQLPCVKVKQGKTKVIWLGDAGIDELLVSFKQCSSTDPAPPENPDCKDASCTLEKAKHKDIQGKLCYTVVVVRDDKTVVVCDPRLIINP